MRQLLTMIVLLLTIGAAARDGRVSSEPVNRAVTGSLTPFRTVTVDGNITAKGVGMRGLGQGVIVLDSIPVGATVVEAWLYWVTIGQNTHFNTILFNNTSISGSFINSSGDTCWGANLNAVYRKEVTAMVPGNGSYSIAGLPNQGAQANDSQGASLVVIYELPGDSERNIIMYDGAVTGNAAGDVYTLQIEQFVANSAIEASLTMLMGDGQTWVDGPLYFNGRDLTQGNSVWGGFEGDFWDTLIFDVTQDISEGDTSATLALEIDNDCLVSPFVALSIGRQGEVLDVFDARYLPTDDHGMVATANQVPDVLGPQMAGITADGISRAIVRFKASDNQPVQLTLDTNLPNGGLLSLADGAPWNPGVSPTNQLTLTPQQVNGTWYAYAVLMAPDEFPAGPSNTEKVDLTLSATSLSGVTEKTLSVYRAPLILIHGLWSSNEAWADLAAFLNTTSDYANSFIHNFDYRNRNNRTWAPSGNPVLLNLYCQILFMFKTRQEAGIICSGVDLVGHSMGGLMSRSLVNYPMARFFDDPRFFRQGFIHHLITVGTPHDGSPMATWLWDHRGNTPDPWSVVATIDWGNDNTLAEHLANRNQAMGTAVPALIPQSQALMNLPSFSQLPYRAIVGVAPDNSDTEQNLNALVGSFDGNPAAMNVTIDTIDGMGGNGGHDTIVDVNSQAGDDAQPAQIPNIVHANVELSNSDVSETTSTAVWNTVVDLLNGVTVRRSVQPDIAPDVGPDISNYNFSTMTELDSSVLGVTPDSGSLLSVAESGSFTLVSTNPGEILEQGFIIVDKAIRGSEGPVFSFEVPLNRPGPLRLRFLGVFQGDKYAVRTVDVTVDPGILTGMYVEASPDLVGPGQAHQLRIWGVRSDLSEVEITGLCTFFLTGAESVLRLEGTGRLVAIAVGRQTVWATYGPLSAFREIRVNNDPLFSLPIFSRWPHEWNMLNLVDFQNALTGE